MGREDRRVSFDSEPPVIVEVPRTDVEESDIIDDGGTAAAAHDEAFDDDAFDAEFEASQAMEAPPAWKLEQLVQLGDLCGWECIGSLPISQQLWLERLRAALSAADQQHTSEAVLNVLESPDLLLMVVQKLKTSCIVMTNIRNSMGTPSNVVTNVRLEATVKRLACVCKSMHSAAMPLLDQERHRQGPLFICEHCLCHLPFFTFDWHLGGQVNAICRSCKDDLIEQMSCQA